MAHSHQRHLKRPSKTRLAFVARCPTASTSTVFNMGVVFSFTVRILTSPAAQALATAEALISLGGRVRRIFRAIVQSDSGVEMVRRIRDRYVPRLASFLPISDWPIEQRLSYMYGRWSLQSIPRNDLICLLQRTSDIARALGKSLKALATRISERYPRVCPLLSLRYNQDRGWVRTLRYCKTLR